ncbi:MAG: DUF2865 domain-containing protein, partial [Pseudorhodoplanes sp.]
MCIGAVLATILIFAEPAAAQGLFESLFGLAPQREAPARSFIDPGDDGGADNIRRRRPAAPDRGSSHAASGGSHTTYCVRLCDGRYFPLQRGAATPAQLCNALCPAAQTRIFSGSGIDRAVSQDGARYV